MRDKRGKCTTGSRNLPARLGGVGAIHLLRDGYPRRHLYAGDLDDVEEQPLLVE